MIKIMFVCHGNICRSPMAELVFKKMVNDRGLSEKFLIASSATSTEEIGNPVYPPARRKLLSHGISPEGKCSVQLTRSDYDKYDMLIGMDSANIRNMLRMLGGDPKSKITKLLDHTDRGGDVADPWYTGNFDATYRDVCDGCAALLEEILNGEKI